MLDTSRQLLSLCWIVAEEESVPNAVLMLRHAHSTCGSAIPDCWQGDADTEQMYPGAVSLPWVGVTPRADPCCYMQAPSLPSLHKPGSSIATSLFVHPEWKTKDIILYALVSNDSIICAGSCSIRQLSKYFTRANRHSYLSRRSRFCLSRASTAAFICYFERGVV